MNNRALEQPGQLLAPAALLERGRAALATARDNLARLQVRDQARAVTEAAKILGRRTVQVYASVLVQDAERALAQANPAQAHGPGRGKKSVVWADGFSASTLRDIRSAHGKVDDPTYALLCEQALETGEPLTRAQVAVVGQTGRLWVRHYTGFEEWYTPPEFISIARTVMGGIDLDPASSAQANTIVQAARYFDKDADGLAHPWAGRVWLNPPYTKYVVAAFTDKLRTHLDRGEVTQAILLTNNATGTQWGARVLTAATAWCFPTRRVRFLDARGARAPASLPLQGQMLLYFGDRAQAFVQGFGAYGPCATPMGSESFQS